MNRRGFFGAIAATVGAGTLLGRRDFVPINGGHDGIEKVDFDVLEYEGSKPVTSGQRQATVHYPELLRRVFATVRWKTLELVANAGVRYVARPSPGTVRLYFAEPVKSFMTSIEGIDDNPQILFAVGDVPPWYVDVSAMNMATGELVGGDFHLLVSEARGLKTA